MYRHIILILLFISITFSVTPTAAENVNFWPGVNSISSTSVNEIANGINDQVLFATGYGLSVYEDGKWTRYYSKATNKIGYLDGIPYDNYIFCVEYDIYNNLWLGYGGALQISDGYTQPLTYSYDQRIIPSYAVNDLQRIGDQMWIAIGEMGVCCYQNGEWIWLPPYESGLGDATRVYDMAIDYASGSLVVTSNQYYIADGEPHHHVMRPDSPDYPYFDDIVSPYLKSDMTHVRSGAHGGVYFFNNDAIVFYEPKSDTVTPVLKVSQLDSEAVRINDLAVAPDNTLVIATNLGVFGVKDNAIVKRLTHKETVLEEIKKVFVDKNNRWWYVNKYLVGYYYDEDTYKAVSAIELPTA